MLSHWYTYILNDDMWCKHKIIDCFRLVALMKPCQITTKHKDTVASKNGAYISKKQADNQALKTRRVIIPNASFYDKWIAFI